MAKGGKGFLDALTGFAESLHRDFGKQPSALVGHHHHHDTPIAGERANQQVVATEKIA
jgi:hypothetical protein